MANEGTAQTTMEPLIDVRAAAELLGIHPVTLAEFARQKRVPAIKIGRVWRFRPSSLEKWIDEQEQRQKP